MEAERTLGHSLRVEDGDLVLEPSPDGLRLAEVRGLENLRQALELRVQTPLGTDRFNTLYGLDFAQIFGSSDGLRATRELVRLNLVRTLGTDPRVADIRSITFAGDDEDLVPHPEGFPDEQRHARVRRTWQAYVMLETSAAEEVSLRLKVGG
jgi:hypothetical protein